MSRFHSLTISDIRRDTRDSAVITLTPADREAFRFVQGQYLTFRKIFDGEEMRRSYSICSGLDDGHLRIGVRRIDGGWFSTFLNDEAKIGDTLEAMAPMGAFHAPLDPAKRRRYLGFAGGSGITPVIGIVRTVMAREPQAAFDLVYANRSTQTIMFREELEDLKNTHMGRLSVTHLLESDAADVDLFTGRPDRAKCDALFDRWIDVDGIDLAFLCGPEPMMLAAADSLKAHGMAEAAIKYELFSSPRSARRKVGGGSAQQAAGAGAIARITLDGTTREIEVAPGQSVLEAAQAASIDAPYACKAGVCSTCRAKIVEGEAAMESNHALEDYEVARGYILTCQARPLTAAIAVDYDQ